MGHANEEVPIALTVRFNRLLFGVYKFKVGWVDRQIGHRGKSIGIWPLSPYGHNLVRCGESKSVDVYCQDSYDIM